MSTRTRARRAVPRRADGTPVRIVRSRPWLPQRSRPSSRRGRGSDCIGVSHDAHLLAGQYVIGAYRPPKAPVPSTSLHRACGSESTWIHNLHQALMGSEVASSRHGSDAGARRSSATGRSIRRVSPRCLYAGTGLARGAGSDRAIRGNRQVASQNATRSRPSPLGSRERLRGDDLVARSGDRRTQARRRRRYPFHESRALRSRGANPALRARKDRGGLRAFSGGRLRAVTDTVEDRDA